MRLLLLSLSVLSAATPADFNQQWGDWKAEQDPWAPDHSAGGSSAAVAAGLCYGSIGSDIGGSIREPPGYGGIVGLKPTSGRVSNRGAIPLSWSLDHLGPMTRRVKDAALMLQVIAGYDPLETTSADLPVPDYTATIAARTHSLRLGVPRAYFYESLHPDIQTAMDAAPGVLKKITASNRDVGPLAANETYSSILDPLKNLLGAEAYAYHQEYISKTPELYQPETLKRLKGGADVAATLYIQSRRQLDQIRRFASRAFETVDLLITPTSPVPPFAIAELLADLSTLRTKELQMLHNTRPFNVLGLPTISVPCGFTQSGLPIGMQITGPPYGEATVLRLAHAYEQSTDWHKRHPASVAS